MESRLVSFIVPAYNISTYIRDCVQSILNQSYRTIECICVDDGSTDGTGHILDELAQSDSRVRVIHQANAGVSAARNVALSCAEGDYLVFVDSDDFLESDFLSAALQDLSQDTSLDIWIGQRVVVEENGEVRKAQPAPIQAGVYDQPIQQFLRMEGRYYLYCVWGKLFRRSLIEQVNLRFLDGVNMGEDALFAAECYACGERVFVSELAKGYFHRQRAGSLARRDWVSRLDETVQALAALENFALKAQVLVKVKPLLVQWALGRISVLFHPGYTLSYLHRYSWALCHQVQFKPLILGILMRYGSFTYAHIARVLKIFPSGCVAEIFWLAVVGYRSVRFLRKT